MKSIRFYFMFLVYLIVIGLYYMQSKDNVILTSEYKAEQTLINHQALRKIVRKHYIPEFKRLKEEGILDKSYLNPLITSGTLITQTLHDLTIPFQLQTAAEATRFKYASLNPINLVNKASQYEEGVLQQILNTKAKKYTEVITEDNKRYLFYATHFAKMEQMCLRCHGDPLKAPLSQIERYGNKHGYNYKVGDNSYLITLRSPLEEALGKMHKKFTYISISILIIFLLLYAVSEWAISRLEVQREKIAKTKEKRNELLREINKDPLTGLLNRRGFEETLEVELNRAKRDKNYLVFFFFDIDYFKQYNDTYGHPQGDIALKVVADILADNFKRSNESVFRLGGEEFGIVSSTHNCEESIQWAEHILTLIQNMKMKHSQSPFECITVSLGINIISSDEENVDIKDIIKGADEALYESKSNGRNQVSVYNGKKCILGFKESLSIHDDMDS